MCAVALGGCYASTEPATNVGSTSAQLNARGTANNGPATSRFEYWITGTTIPKYTAPQMWPAGSSGPFSAKVTDLAASTSYSFRVCGGDNSGGGATTCAQTRTFKTSAPAEDSVTGGWFVSPHLSGEVDAHSGPAGQNPLGSISDVYAPIDYNAFEGFVTCLSVDGDQAAVGAVGQQTLPDGQTKRPATLLLTVVDGGATGSDTLGRFEATGSTPPDCASAPFDQQTSLGSGSTLVVNDAP